MKKYNVNRGTTFTIVEAESFTGTNLGALVFLVNDKFVAAFAPGTWVSVTEVKV